MYRFRPFDADNVYWKSEIKLFSCSGVARIGFDDSQRDALLFGNRSYDVFSNEAFDKHDEWQYYIHDLVGFDLVSGAIGDVGVPGAKPVFVVRSKDISSVEPSSRTISGYPGPSGIIINRNYTFLLDDSESLWCPIGLIDAARFVGCINYNNLLSSSLETGASQFVPVPVLASLRRAITLWCAAVEGGV